MFNLEKVFGAQDKLDRAVVQAHGLEGRNLTGDVTHALYVELGELQQEIGYFKYWKKTMKTNEDDQREEWADCMHFLASLGNKYGHVEMILNDEVQNGYKCQITKLLKRKVSYHNLFEVIYKSDFNNVIDYGTALICLLAIGKKLGMTYEDMEEQYFAKNKINYDRIAANY